MDKQLKKVFGNRYISICTYVDGDKISEKEKISIGIKLSKNEDPIAFSFDDEGYWSIGKDKSIDSFIVNEYNVCNKLLMDIFEEVVPRRNSKTNYHRIECDEEVANYLIKTSRQSDDYVYENGYLYDANRNKVHYLSVLDKVTNSFTNSKDAIEANKCLESIVESMPLKDLKTLIGCSLCFCGKEEDLNGMEEAQPHSQFGKDDEIDAKPMCKSGSDRRKIIGLIKHVYYKLKKQQSSPKYVEDPYKKFDMLYNYLSNRFSDSITSTNGSEITIIRNGMSFIIKLESNNKPSITFGDDGSSKISNLSSAKMIYDFIANYA